MIFSPSSHQTKIECTQLTFLEPPIRQGCFHFWVSVPTGAGAGAGACALWTDVFSALLDQTTLRHRCDIFNPLLYWQRPQILDSTKLSPTKPWLKTIRSTSLSVNGSLSVDRSYTGVWYFRWGRRRLGRCTLDILQGNTKTVVLDLVAAIDPE